MEGLFLNREAGSVSRKAPNRDRDGDSDGGCVSSSAGEGWSDIAHEHIGRGGIEVWSLASHMLDKSIVLADLSPAQNAAISRFYANLRMWGFVLQPLEEPPASWGAEEPATPNEGGATSSYFSERREGGEKLSRRGPAGWQLVAVPVVMGTHLGTNTNPSPVYSVAQIGRGCILSD